MKQKSENQKALPKFFKLLAVAGLIGGVLGSLSSVAGYFWQEHDLGAAFARMLNAGSLWGMLVCSAVLLGIGLRLYRSAGTPSAAGTARMRRSWSRRTNS